MNVKIKFFHLFIIVFLPALFVNPMLFSDASAQTDNPPFSIASQPYAFDPNAKFFLMEVDDNTNQDEKIKQLVRKSADHISSQTIMTFTEVSHLNDAKIAISTYDELFYRFSAQVITHEDFHSGNEIKILRFNTNPAYTVGFSENPGCGPISLFYLTNHELGHVAGLDHIRNLEDSLFYSDGKLVSKV